MKHFTDDELVDYLHAELGDGADAAVHAHLAVCSDCRTRCDAEAAVGDMLRTYARGSERELPATLRANVWASIRAARPGPLERFRAVLSPMFAVPLAVAAALLLYLGGPIVRGGSSNTSTVSAAYYLEEHAAEGQETPLADRTAVSTVAARPVPASVPLIEAADAATLDDVVAAQR